MKRLIGIALCLTITAASFAQVTEKQIAAADSIALRKKYIKSNRFFDGLKERSKKSEFTNFIVNSIVVNKDWTGRGAREASKKLTDETRYFSTFEGKEIAAIHILPKNVYGDTTDHFIPKLVNSVHVKTRERIIRQNLLFKVGDQLDAATMILNEELLRRLNYIADAYIIIAPYDEEEDKVEIFVHSRDQWSINAAFYEKRAMEEYRVSVYDENFIGIGHRITGGSYFRLGNPVWSGYRLGYNIHNFSGSFFDADFLIDRSYEESTYMTQVKKALIKPSDYAVGFLYQLYEGMEGQMLTDTAYHIKRQIFDVWGGVSRHIKNSKQNIYTIGRVTNTQNIDYDGYMSETINPYYRSPLTALLSVGIYSESFYRGSHIYSFGVSEDIPHGYKLELTGGRAWDEYANRNYLALGWSAGFMNNFGFLQHSITYGSYFLDDFTPQQSVFSAGIDYFTNLYKVGKGHIRNFLYANYTAGFHRLDGEREKITFNNNNTLRMLGLQRETYGLSRLLFRTESVYFAPIYFYNFRIAFYGFCDFGWLNDNYYKLSSHDFYTTVGAGFRILNDRLIFRSIQLQFGYAVINPSHGNKSWIELSDNQRMRMMRFTPDVPSVIEYQ